MSEQKKKSEFQQTREKVTEICNWYINEGLPSGSIDHLLENQARAVGMLDFIGARIGHWDVLRSAAENDYDEQFAQNFTKIKNDHEKKMSDELTKQVCKLAGVGIAQRRDTAQAAYRAYTKLYNTTEKLYESMRSAISKLKGEKERYESN